MSEVHQAASSSLARASQTTRGLVVVYHFLVATILIVAILVDWLTVSSSENDLFMLKGLSAVGVPFALVYGVAGWRILRWRNWSRTLSLFLNWLNVIPAVLMVMSRRINLAGAVSVLLSCLVLWWLSMPAVKLEFRRRSEAE
jgi:hypothetical protein